MLDINPQDVLVRMLDTPNPKAFKFVLNVPLKNTGQASFYKPSDCEGLLLFSSIFEIKEVKHIYVLQNQMTLTLETDFSPEKLEKQVEQIVFTRIKVHDPSFLSSEEKTTKTTNLSKKKKSSLSPLELKIESILDQHIRPGLNADGGGLDLISAKDNEVHIAYQGACGGCPSAMMGTLEAIESILCQELKNPQIKVIPN